MKSLLKYFLFFLPALFAACSSSGYFSEDISGDRRVLVISDVHISNDSQKDNRFKKIIEMVNSGEIKADMVVFTGDNVSSIFWGDSPRDHSTVNSRLLKFRVMLKKLQVPHYVALGNHDYKIDKSKDSDDPFSYQEIFAAEKLWEEKGGIIPYYSAEDFGWKFIMLNSMRGRYLERNFDNEQMAWLRAELVTESSVLVFFHHPLETDDVSSWCKSKDLITDDIEPELYSILESNKDKIKGIFVGHGHMFESDLLFEKIMVFETDSFGDAEGLTFSLVGIDTAKDSITVVPYDDIEIGERVRN